ncbi:MAG TPA: BACON domain-containing protein [Vicinamibacterales bacterium]|nr:BACON domain-containing protein [Vicinamibacterales bacterium]
MFLAAIGPVLNCTTQSSPLAPLVPGIAQTGCVSSLSPASQSFTAAGGPGVGTVMAPVGCAWTATSASSFLTFVGSPSGSGPGFFQYTVGSNATLDARQATIAVDSFQTNLTQSVVSGGTFLVFSSGPTDYIGGGQPFVAMPPTQIIAPSMDAPNHVRFQIANATSPATVLWELNVRASGSEPLAPGTYQDAGYWPAAVTRPAMSFWGGGRGCGAIQGQFTILEAAIAPGPVLTRFHATFVQHCNGRPDPLEGEVSYGR